MSLFLVRNHACPLGLGEFPLPLALVMCGEWLFIPFAAAADSFPEGMGGYVSTRHPDIGNLMELVRAHHYCDGPFWDQ